MIRRAKRPVVLVGLQCRGGDAKWLRAFCEALPAPVLATYKAKGALPDPHPLALGVFTGGALEEPVVGRADLIITFGLDTVEMIPRRWSYEAPVLSLVRAPSAASAGGGSYFTPALELVGDLGLILEELAPRLRGHHADWDVVEVDRLRRERQRALEIAVPGLAPHRIVQIAREYTPAGTIATVDAGAHMFQAAEYWQAVSPGNSSSRLAWVRAGSAGCRRSGRRCRDRDRSGARLGRAILWADLLPACACLLPSSCSTMPRCRSSR